MRIRPFLLVYVPDHLKTQKMRSEVVQKIPLLLVHVPDDLKTQEMCIGAVKVHPLLSWDIPDHFKTEEMYIKILLFCSFSLISIRRRRCVMMCGGETLSLCSLSPIGLLQGSGYTCGMMTLMKIIFLSSIKGIKNERLKKPQKKKSSYPLLGTHHAGGIGVVPKTRRKRQKNCF